MNYEELYEYREIKAKEFSTLIMDNEIELAEKVAEEIDEINEEMKNEK